MAGRLNIERVINTHTTVLRRKNSIIQHAPTSDIRRVRRDMVRVVLVFSKNNPLPIVCAIGRGEKSGRRPTIYVIAVAHSVSGLTSQTLLHIIDSGFQNILRVRNTLLQRQGNAQTIERAGAMLRALETFQVTNARSLNEAGTLPTA